MEKSVMPSTVQKVVVIGHNNPDTDSICSAIAYAELKNKTTDLICEPRRAGKLNRESKYVLERFGVPVPRMCTDVNPKIRNVEYRRIDGVSRHTSMREAWMRMRDEQIDSLPVVDSENELEGLITVNKIAVANMDVFDNTVLAKSRTTYKNILKTLDGRMIIGDENSVVDERAHVLIGTASPEVLEENVRPGDIVILSNRYESQLCCIEMEASLIIVCQGAEVGKTIKRLAEDNGVAIMGVPCDTYAAAKLISQCAPIEYFMDTAENLQKFTLVTPVADAVDVMSKTRHRYFPILDGEGKYCGMLSNRNIINLSKRRLILVDHNERTQAIEGFENSEILEIIDHHRIGNLETTNPVLFRNQPVGSTCTIVAQMYEEEGVEFTPKIAGLLLSGILSDTLKFTSPTCTKLDKAKAKMLAKIAGVEIDTYAAEMFAEAERLDGRKPEEVFMQDFKMFMCGDTRFGVAQGNYLTPSNLIAAEKMLAQYLPEALVKHNAEDIFVILTDITKSSSYVICTGMNADRVLKEAFDTDPGEDGGTYLEGLVSRKKQFIPKIMEAYQNLL